MFHLLVGDLVPYALVWVFAAKMFHLTVATCKDASSFGRGPSFYALV